MRKVITKLCGWLTKHRLRYEYSHIPYYRDDPEHPEYYCRCRLCGHHYWTDKPKKRRKGAAA